MDYTGSNLEISPYYCPKCGSPMRKKPQSAYMPSGTATQWPVWPVSSSGSSVVSMYPGYEIYECTNITCRRNLLRSPRPGSLQNGDAA